MAFKKNQIIYLVLVCILTFVLVFTPHFNNPFPIHIDEWHHITESIKFSKGAFVSFIFGVEIGFHLFLSLISRFFDLVLIYKFLPALWTVISGIILFFVIIDRTRFSRDSFLIAIFSMIFFASIKSNTNITGLWFFTPLTFAIPFIFLYIHFFTKGFEEKKIGYVLISWVIMLFLIPVHSISLLFSIPFLLIYSYFHRDFIIENYKFFLMFLVIPIMGILFYSYIRDLSLIGALKELLIQLQFRKGWGVLERNNSPFEIYSFIGYVFAFIGLVIILSRKKLRKRYFIFPLWTLSVLVYIIVFKITGISFLSPYQRNVYYFAISLPVLSAFGFVSVWNTLNLKIKETEVDNTNKVYRLIQIFFIFSVLFFTFISYNSIPQNTRLYQVVDEDSYDALKFLSLIVSEKDSKVMAPIFTSTAMFPISGHEPVGTIFFYGSREDVVVFFNGNCSVKDELIEKYNVKYVLFPKLIDCGWKIIYNDKNQTIYDLMI